MAGLWWACVWPMVGLWWAYGGLVLGLWWHGVGLWWAYGGLVVGLCWAYGGMGYGIHTVGCVVCLCVCYIMGRGVLEVIVMASRLVFPCRVRPPMRCGEPLRRMIVPASAGWRTLPCVCKVHGSAQNLDVAILHKRTAYLSKTTQHTHTTSKIPTSHMKYTSSNNTNTSKPNILKTATPTKTQTIAKHRGYTGLYAGYTLGYTL